MRGPCLGVSAKMIIDIFGFFIAGPPFFRKPYEAEVDKTCSGDDLETHKIRVYLRPQRPSVLGPYNIILYTKS